MANKGVSCRLVTGIYTQKLLFAKSEYNCTIIKDVYYTVDENSIRSMSLNDFPINLSYNPDAYGADIYTVDDEYLGFLPLGLFRFGN